MPNTRGGSIGAMGNIGPEAQLRRSVLRFLGIGFRCRRHACGHSGQWPLTGVNLPLALRGRVPAPGRKRPPAAGVRTPGSALVPLGPVQGVVRLDAQGASRTLDQGVTLAARKRYNLGPSSRVRLTGGVSPHPQTGSVYHAGWSNAVARKSTKARTLPDRCLRLG